VKQENDARPVLPERLQHPAMQAISAAEDHPDDISD